jgi:hypothetical protein
VPGDTNKGRLPNLPGCASPSARRALFTDILPLASAPPEKITKKQAKSYQARQAAYAAKRSKQQLADLMPAFVNWDYTNWRDIWRSIRHAMIGEVAIKQQGKMYLPQPEGMDDGQYAAYLDRAVFYNMVYRTVTGLTGAIFRRDPRLLKASTNLTALTKRVSKDGLSLNIFAKVVAQEMLSVGRFGILADKAASDSLTAKPYLAGYTCENILDWTWTEIDGRNEYDYILLREFIMDRRMWIAEGKQLVSNPSYGQLFCAYRCLRLIYNPEFDRWEYIQEYYTRGNEDADLTEDPEITQPLIFGVPMNRIPFSFFNATTNLGDIEKPPVLDILSLNLSHYKTYAQLEHGRFYTANPVYWVSGSQEDDEYLIGPSVVWEIGTNEKAGLIEFNGQGLKSLEIALSTKETQVASLGGRLIGDAATAGQSDNQIKLKDRNEQSLLLNVTTVINENFTFLLGILAQWMNENTDGLEFRVNQDFLLDGAAAREFRAVAQMYADGMVPIEIFYEYFLKNEVIPDYVDLETFKNLLEDANQFPNDPDFEARVEGYKDAASKVSSETQIKVAEITAGAATDVAEANNDTKVELQESQQQHDAQQNAQQRKTDEKVAKNQPRIPPVPTQGRQALQRDATKPAGGTK